MNVMFSSVVSAVLSASRDSVFETSSHTAVRPCALFVSEVLFASAPAYARPRADRTLRHVPPTLIPRPLLHVKHAQCDDGAGSRAPLAASPEGGLGRGLVSGLSRRVSSSKRCSSFCLAGS